jgi:hypothetical protein
LIWFKCSEKIVGYGLLGWSKAQTWVEKPRFVEANTVHLATTFFNVGLNSFPSLEASIIYIIVRH